jgi:hypothetical protein
MILSKANLQRIVLKPRMAIKFRKDKNKKELCSLALNFSDIILFICRKEQPHASMFANIMLFSNLVAVIVLSAKLLTIFAYISVKCLGGIQLDVNTLFAFSICGIHDDCSELIISLCFYIIICYFS